MAFYGADRPTQIREIAERERIPVRFLEQIFQELRKAGIVSSKRGPQGGYILARDPAAIRLGDPIRALDGPLLAPESRTPAAARRKANPDSYRVLDAAFTELSTRIEACFDQMNIADLCTRAEELGLTRPGSYRSIYYI